MSSLGFVFVIVFSPKCAAGWAWVVSHFGLDLGNGNGDKGGDDSRDGGGGKYWSCCNKLNNDNSVGGPGSGGMKLLNVGKDDRGGSNPLLLLFLLNLLLLFCNASSLFCILESTPDVGGFLIRLLTVYFFSNV